MLVLDKLAERITIQCPKTVSLRKFIMKISSIVLHLAIIAPLSMAYAFNPSSCLAPRELYSSAVAGVIHDFAPAVKVGKIQPGAWYTVGEFGYASGMELLSDKNRQWEDGGLGFKDGRRIVCSYRSIKSHDYVDLQRFHIVKRSMTGS